MTTRVRFAGITLGVVAALALAAPALAHVHVETDNARPGATAEYTLGIPNESDSADTTTIEVQLPAGFAVTAVRPGKGWEMEVEGGVLIIEGGAIKPGQERDFRFTGINPRERGTLTFPAIQTYSDGQEVRWVGETGSDRPAAQVEITGKPVAVVQPPASESEAPGTEPGVPDTEPAETEPSSASEPPVSEAPAADDTSSGSDLPLVPIAVAVVAVALILVLLRRGRSA